MKLISVALAALLLTFACDPEPEESDAVLTAEECEAAGGRLSLSPGGGAPACDDDEVQIGWVAQNGRLISVERSRCCVPD